MQCIAGLLSTCIRLPLHARYDSEQARDLLGEAALGAEVSLDDGPVNGLDGRPQGKGDVEDVEVALQSWGDVVATAARVGHSRDVLHVDDVLPNTGLVDIVEAAVLEELADDFVGDLHVK